jgi:flavin-dependent dehydrogenase
MTSEMTGAPSAPPDLLIAGAGPAGLATAIRARQRGLSATVLDASRPPLDKACGEGLMPDARLRLEELGVRLPAAASAVFRGIRYVDGDPERGGTVAEAEFPSGHGLGVRRTALHRALLERAEELGAEICWETRITGLLQSSGEVGVETTSGNSQGRRRGRYLVAADGLRSRLRRWAGLEGPPARLRRFGVRRHYAMEPWTAHVEVWWADGFEAYVTPVSAGEVGVALLWSGRKAGFDDLLAGLPALARRLEGAEATSRDRGCGPLAQNVRAVHRGRLALVGDASGYVDAITGEGLALAFHQAFSLVEAIEAEDLSLYARAHRRHRRLPDALTRALLFAERRPWLRRRAIAALAADPDLFRRLLGVHARTLPPKDVGLKGVLRLAWGLARG